jgi:hypothetical protein
MRNTETIGDTLPRGLEPRDIELSSDEALRIIDVIGDDCAITLESDAAFIDFCENLRQTENPFIDSPKNPVDLSIVDSKTADLVNEFRGSTDTFSFEPTKKGILRGGSDRRAYKFGMAAQAMCRATKDLLTEEFNILQDTRSRVIDLSPRSDTKPSSEDVNNFQFERAMIAAPEQFQEILNQLAVTANELPGTDTTLVIKQIASKIRDHFKKQDKSIGGDTPYIQRVIIEKATEVTDSLNDLPKSHAEDLIKHADDLNAQELRVVEDGKKTYDLLITSIARQEYLFALSTIATAKIARGNIRFMCESSPNSDQLDILLLSEEFIRERVNVAANIVRANLSPEERFKFNKSIEFEFNESEVSMVAAQKDLAEKQTDPAEFSRLVTEARDILKGGRRLVKYGNEKRVQELADRLIRLRDDNRVGETRVLEVEECGLIIASIMGRFGDFTDTQAHIKMDHPDRGLHDLEKQRPEEIKLIRGFNLPGAMKKLNSLITTDHTCDLICKILDQEEFSALEETLHRYHIETERTMADEGQRLSEAV